jgi:DNA oxidative demethylase
VVPGFTYATDFLAAHEEEELLRHCEALTYAEVRMHGVVARRRVVHFGQVYQYGGRGGLVTGPPAPEWLAAVLGRAHRWAAAEAAFEAILVTRYPQGAGIGWHRDAPMFGEPVVGISLGSAARLRFRRVSDHEESWEIRLEPGSAYALRGSARWQWQHQMPPVPLMRYSITARVLRGER